MRIDSFAAFNTYGDGVLVVANKDKWIEKARSSGKHTSGFVLNISQEEKTRLKDTIRTLFLVTDIYGAEIRDSSLGAIRYKFTEGTKYKTYDFLRDNCATIVI